MNENVIKGICKVLMLTLHRYKDSRSQKITQKLICNLVEKYPETSIKTIISLLLDIANRQKNVIATYGWRYYKHLL